MAFFEFSLESQFQLFSEWFSGWSLQLHFLVDWSSGTNDEGVEEADKSVEGGQKCVGIVGHVKTAMDELPRISQNQNPMKDTRMGSDDASNGDALLWPFWKDLKGLAWYLRLCSRFLIMFWRPLCSFESLWKPKVVMKPLRLCPGKWVLAFLCTSNMFS